MSQLLSQPMPKGGINEARHALEALEIKRLNNLLQRTQTQLKQSGLTNDQIATLTQHVVTIRKEYLDRLAQLPKIPPSPAT